MSRPEPQLASAAFVAERQDAWRRLHEIVTRVERSGLDVLTPKEQLELVHLYRATLSSLSVVRTIVIDRKLTEYLEALTHRAYFAIYTPRSSLLDAFGDFFVYELPRAFRLIFRPIAFAAAVLALGAIIGWLLVDGDAERFFQLMPENLAQGRTPYSTTESLRASVYAKEEAKASMLEAFSAFLFRHNAGVALLSFSLGIALGIPTLLITFYNGTLIGALFAVFHGRGLGVDMLAWLSVHGTTELLALCMASGAGLALAQAVLFPREREGRLAAAARCGRVAGTVALGAIALLLVAALLEGFARQWIQPPAQRFAIGGTAALLWAMYFSLAGRGTNDR